MKKRFKYLHEIDGFMKMCSKIKDIVISKGDVGEIVVYGLKKGFYSFKCYARHVTIIETVY